MSLDLIVERLLPMTPDATVRLVNQILSGTTDLHNDRQTANQKLKCFRIPHCFPLDLTASLQPLHATRFDVMQGI